MHLPRRLCQALELCVVFVALPLLVLFELLPLPKFSVLFFVALVYLLVLVFDHSFDRELFSMKRFSAWRPLLMRFIAFVIVSAVVVAFIAPQSLFRLPGRSVGVWLSIMVLYPLFSVLPQSIIYRVYFFHRFEGLFKNQEFLVLVNALCFALLHVLFRNWLAVAMTFVGGIFFAVTYLKSKSLLVTAVEHALYGDWIFTVGIGSYFYLQPY